MKRIIGLWLCIFSFGCVDVSKENTSPIGGSIVNTDTNPAKEVTYETKAFSGKYQAYDANLDKCSSWFEFSFIGYEPVADGKKFPLLIYTVGTLDNYQNPVVQDLIRRAASKGFVAISVQYYNPILSNCSEGFQRAQCIYSASDSKSAISNVCERSNVDCRQVFTMGHSQGAGLAIASKNINSNVQATTLLGASTTVPISPGGFGLSNPDPTETEFNCLHHSNLVLKSDRIRILNGDNEPFGDWATLNRMTNDSCPEGQADCLNNDGGGWYIVPSAAVEDGDADHNFFVYNDSTVDRLDAGFVDPSKEWSLYDALRWFKVFVQ